MTTNTYVDVTVVNNADKEIGFRFPDTEEGQSLIRTLQSKVRREELKSIKVGGKAVKGPEYDEVVEPERRRGRPVEGKVEGAAVVETTDNPAQASPEGMAKGEAEAQEKARKAEAKDSK